MNKKVLSPKKTPTASRKDDSQLTRARILGIGSLFQTVVGGLLGWVIAFVFFIVMVAVVETVIHSEHSQRLQLLNNALTIIVAPSEWV